MCNQPKPMKTTDLIDALQRALEAHGDVPVVINDKHGNTYDLEQVGVAAYGHVWVVLS